MRKFVLPFLLVGLMASATNAQVVVIEDDFESYTVNGFIAVQSPIWDTWTMSPGSAEDAPVSNEVAFSGTKSLRIQQNGTLDIVLPIGPYTTGIYEIEFMMYVPQGNGAYFNLMHNWPTPYEWATDVWFSNNGTVYNMVFQTQGTNGTYPAAQWFKVVALVNLDTDQATLTVNNQLLHTWQWSINHNNGAPGQNKLAAVNFYGHSPQGQQGLYYIDDVKVTHVNGVSVAETSKDIAFNVFPVPANDVLRINASSAGAYQLTMFDLSGKVVHSARVVNSLYEMNVKNFSEGVYFLRMEGNHGVLTKKVVVQH
jgi:hypothetical protein